MALTWDCSPAKSCYDVGRARYTMDGQAATQNNEAMDLTEPAGSRSPNKVRFAWQQGSAGDGINPLGDNRSQDICSYPMSSFGPPFAPPRYLVTHLVYQMDCGASSLVA